MKTLALSLMLALLPFLCSAQESPTEIIEQFFQDFEKLEPNEALDNLYANMPWAERIQDEVDKLKYQFGNLPNLVGNYHGYEFITVKGLGNTFEIHSYLVKFDRQPVRFTFQFYKPQDKWGVYAFSYDDNFDDELEQATKLYYLDLDH